MKAWIADDYGPPSKLRLGEIETPAPKDGYLLVRLRAASANPFDVKLITGMMKEYMPITFPFVPGMDGAGVVERTGSGVTGYSTGDPVFGMFGESGTFAEFATISAQDLRLARKPDALDFVHAAAIPEAGLTAMTILRAADVHADQQVLVIGATGGVGHFVTQLARARGARVIATGRTQDAGYLRTLGAEEVIDYGAGDIVKEVRQRYPDGLDAVVDLINSGEKLLPVANLVRRDGTLVSSLFGPDQSAFPEDVNVRYIHLDAHPGDLEELGRRAAAGELRVEVAETYPFTEAKQALIDLVDPHRHTRGKLVVTIP
ncbi:MAG: NADP-dependent oxidoreductase [Vulcanimicrobiaceae bacterium]